MRKQADPVKSLPPRKPEAVKDYSNLWRLRAPKVKKEFVPVVDKEYQEHPALAFRDFFDLILLNVPNFNARILTEAARAVSSALSESDAIEKLCNLLESPEALLEGYSAAVVDDRKFGRIYLCLSDLYKRDKGHWEKALSEEIEIAMNKVHQKGEKSIIKPSNPIHNKPPLALNKMRANLLEVSRRLRAMIK